MRVGVTLKDGEETIFETYDDAMDYIEGLIPEVEGLHISTDDILIKYYE